MNLDDQLESMEETGQTEAEQIDEETEIQDVCDDVDELLGPDAEESDLEHAYDSFITNNETDYDGYDPTHRPDEVVAEEDAVLESDLFHSEGYSIQDTHDLEGEVIEMEIEEGDIYAYIHDEDDTEIGFVLIDEDGNEEEYYYVDAESSEVVDEEGDKGVVVERASDGEEFDLGLTREDIADTTDNLNAIYKDGVEIVSELKDAFSDISEGMSFMKKRN